MAFNNSNSWVILTEMEKSIKEKIERFGTPLKEWDLSINYGIKTGCNDAFIITGEKRRELIEQDPKSEEIIRPILRGRDIKRYSYDFADLWLINTHNGIKEKSVSPVNIDEYAAIKDHLDNYLPALETRFDKGSTPYNLRNCAYMDDFYKHKIIWIELSDNANFALETDNLFINNTIFFITGSRLKYLLAFLNSKICQWYFKKLAATSGVGTTRWIKQYIEKIYVPHTTSDEPVFENLVEQIMDFKSNKKETTLLESEINNNFYRLFTFDKNEIEFIENQ